MPDDSRRRHSRLAPVQASRIGPRLVLYSDQIPPITDPIDDRLFGMLPPSPKIGYLPAGPDPDRSWFQSRQAHYGRRNATLSFFGLENDFDPSRMEELLASDAIHLSGGNTFQFLYWLRERGMSEPLKRYAQTGGVLIGVSAGAILMTPSVQTSYLCGDAPFPGLDDLTGLALVEFACVPHYRGPTPELQAFADRFLGPIYAVPDGAGIVVEGDSIELFGDVIHAR